MDSTRLTSDSFDTWDILPTQRDYGHNLFRCLLLSFPSWGGSHLSPWCILLPVPSIRVLFLIPDLFLVRGGSQPESVTIGSIDECPIESTKFIRGYFYLVFWLSCLWKMITTNRSVERIYCKGIRNSLRIKLEVTLSYITNIHHDKRLTTQGSG